MLASGVFFIRTTSTPKPPNVTRELKAQSAPHCLVTARSFSNILLAQRLTNLPEIQEPAVKDRGQPQGWGVGAGEPSWPLKELASLQTT